MGFAKLKNCWVASFRVCQLLEDTVGCLAAFETEIHSWRARGLGTAHLRLCWKDALRESACSVCEMLVSSKKYPCPERRCWSRGLVKKAELDSIISICAVYKWYLEGLCHAMHCKVLHYVTLYVENFNKSFAVFLWKVASFLIIHLCPVILVLKSVKLLCFKSSNGSRFLGEEPFYYNFWTCFFFILLLTSIL